MLPAMARLLPESERWELSEAAGFTARSHFYDVFQPLYRKRSITMIVCALAIAISTTAANAFGYYHAVSVVGLSAAAASAMTIVAGGIGLSRVSTRRMGGGALRPRADCGRLRHFHHRRTFVVFLGTTGAFRVAVDVAVGRLFLVQRMRQRGHRRDQRGGDRTVSTPLRGTMIGWFALVGAIGAVISNAAVAMLANAMGGLSMVVGALSIIGIPAAILFGLMIDETRGMSLEMAGKEMNSPRRKTDPRLSDTSPVILRERLGEGSATHCKSPPAHTFVSS